RDDEPGDSWRWRADRLRPQRSAWSSRRSTWDCRWRSVLHVEAWAADPGIALRSVCLPHACPSMLPFAKILFYEGCLGDLGLGDGGIHRRPQHVDGGIKLCPVRDEWRRKQNVIASSAIDGASSRIAHQTAIKRMLPDTRMQLNAGLVGRIG